jgi:hypothetical protein
VSRVDESVYNVDPREVDEIGAVGALKPGATTEPDDLLRRAPVVRVS